MPSYGKWQKKFAKEKFTILSIHTPETEGEKIPANVVKHAKKWKIDYPILIDHEGKNWMRWQQQYWPTCYLIDKWGHVRYYWMGELEWENAGGEKIMERYIAKLLKEPYTPPEDEEKQDKEKKETEKKDAPQ